MSFGGSPPYQVIPPVDKEEAAVPEMVKIGLKESRPYGPPTSTAGKIEYRFDVDRRPLIWLL